MIKTYSLVNFCKKYPCFRSTFRELLSDKNYIVKVDEDNGLIGGIEIGYPTDKFFLT